MELLGNEFFAVAKLWWEWFPVDLAAVLAVVAFATRLARTRFIPAAIVLVGVMY